MSNARRSWVRTALVFVAFVCVAATASADTVRVIVDRALIWNRPAGVSVIVTQVPKDTILEVSRRAGDWYEVVLPAGAAGPSRTGFIRAVQVAVESTAPLSAQAQAAIEAARQAQPSAVKQTGFFHLDGVRRAPPSGLERVSKAFGDRYGEDGSLDVKYGTSGGWDLSVMMGKAIWGNIGVGVGGEYYLHDEPAVVDASVPNPFFFNQPRKTSLTTEALSAHEAAIHVPVVFMPPLGGRFKVMAYAGPSIFRISQVVVTDLVLNDPYPNDVVTATSAITDERRGWVMGFHAGADVAYFFVPGFGVGVGGRYTRATMKFSNDAGATSTGVSGAVEVMGGLRARF